MRQSFRKATLSWPKSVAQPMELSKRVEVVTGVCGPKSPLVGLVRAVSRMLNSAKMKTHPNPMNRRSFLGSALAAVATASVGRNAVAAEEPSATSTRGAEPSLREKFFGCIAGCHIGSAMGAPLEGWSWERIEREGRSRLGWVG